MPTEAFGTTITKKKKKKRKKEDESPGAVPPSKHEKTGKYWFGQKIHLGFSVRCYKNPNEHFGQPNAIRINLFRILAGEKDLHDPDNHNGVITHLEPDILECAVKWALGSITMNKASGGDGIPGDLFQILKDDAVKVLHPICQEIWKTQQWP